MTSYDFTKKNHGNFPTIPTVDRSITGCPANVHHPWPQKSSGKRARLAPNLNSSKLSLNRLQHETTKIVKKNSNISNSYILCVSVFLWSLGEVIVQIEVETELRCAGGSRGDATLVPNKGQWWFMFNLAWTFRDIWHIWHINEYIYIYYT